MMRRIGDLDNSTSRRAAPDLLAWMNVTPLNMAAGMRYQRDDPVVESALRHFAANAKPTAENLQFVAEVDA